MDESINFEDAHKEASSILKSAYFYCAGIGGINNLMD